VHELTGEESLPDAVVNYATQNELGIAVLTSPDDQSTCDHLASELMSDQSTVKDDRCHFYEPFSGSNLWVVLDDELAAPEAGTYKIAVFEANGMSSKAAFACCDWPEDFITAFTIPETECAACGSSPFENPAWTSLFFEQKTMEDYGGYPPFQKCDESNPIELPQGDNCPAVVNVTDQPLELSESCTPSCSNDGVCHNHNVFGGCNWTVDWALEPRLGEAMVKKIVLFKGDTVQFKHSANDGLVHNLFQLLDESALDTCAFDGSSELANVEEVRVGHELTFSEAGVFHYTCSIGCGDTGNSQMLCHCEVGQKLTIQVKDASEGMRCHSHGSDSHGSDSHESDSDPSDSHGMVKEEAPVEMLACEEGNVRAYILEDSNYGGSDNECSELCTVAFALSFMIGVEEGSCTDQGFTYQVEEKEVQPPGSPMPMNVMIYSSSAPVVGEDSDCHCHSYEEIACPQNETVSDTLYTEHIEELATFCQDVIDGTETNCPYTCFQPMEVLHLHYLECPSRVVDSLYSTIDASGMCHAGTTDVPEDMKSEEKCPTVDLSDAASKESNGQEEAPVSEDLDEATPEEKDGGNELADNAATSMGHVSIFVAAGFLLSLAL